MEKLSFIGSTSFGFAQNTLHDFQKYGIEVIVGLRQMPQK